MSASPRPLALLRAAWGLLLLTAPQQVTSRLGGNPDDRREQGVFRVLGARHLVQAVASGASSGPAVLAVGAWVDLVHSLSGVVLAVLDRRRARVALADAAIAVTWALTSRADARRVWAHPDAVVAGSWREQVARALLPHLPGAPSRPPARW